MISNFIGLFFILLAVGDVHCIDVPVKVGDKINLCCSLTFDKADALIVFVDSQRLYLLFGGELRPADIKTFKEKYPDYEAEKINSTICLTKNVAALTDEKFSAQCKVQKQGMFETISEEQITLRIYEELKFETDLPEYLDISIGEIKFLQCRASGSPDLQVIWRTEKRGKIADGISSANLTVKDVTIDMNQLKYTCEASISIPPNNIIQKTIKLNVLYPPEIIVEMSIVHTDLGDSEIVKVTVKGNPQPKFDCGIMNIPADRILKTSNIDPSHYIYQVEILNITEKNIGDYICTAKNSQGEVSKKIHISLRPAGLLITSPNSTAYSNCYVLTWTINSKSLLKNISITIEMQQDDSWSMMKSVVVTDNELNSYQKSIGSQNNNWERSYRFPIMNLTSEKLYKISLKVCNRHECSESTNAAVVKTPISDDTNRFDPKYQFENLTPGKLGVNNAEFKSTLLVVITQSIAVLLLPLMLQQIY